MTNKIHKMMCVCGHELKHHDLFDHKLVCDVCITTESPIVLHLCDCMEFKQVLKND